MNVKKYVEVMEETLDYLQKDSRAYNVCMVRSNNHDNLPLYISFCVWYDLRLVVFKLFLNKDLKTYELTSNKITVIKKVKLDLLFRTLAKYDLTLVNNDFSDITKVISVKYNKKKKVKE